MTNEEMKQYEAEPSAFWQSVWILGDGYSVIERAIEKGWHVVSSWGALGWDLGSWPLVIMFFRNTKDGKFDLIYYCEGDVTLYSCPTREIRERITDELAFFHWKAQDESWVKGYETVDQLPPELRGPYSEDRGK